MNRARSLVLVLICYAVIASSHQAVADDAADQTLIESLDAAVDQWLHDVEFVCTYRRSGGYAATAEQGLKGEIAVEIKMHSISGAFNKGFGKMRCSGDYELPLKVAVKSPDGGRGVVYRDFDEVSGAEMQMSYVPVLEPGGSRGEATFRPRKLPDGSNWLPMSRYAAGPSSFRRQNPLSINGSLPGSYLKSPEGAETVSKSVLHADGERIVVLVSYEHLKTRTERRVEFRLTGSVPVVEKDSFIQHYPNHKPIESRTEAFDFVECPGGPVARLLRTVSTHSSTEQADLPWFVTEWRSEDLGDRAPAREDFLVPIRENTTIRGLLNSKAALQDGKLDIDKLSMRQLDRRAAGATATHAALAAEQPRPRSMAWLLWLNLGIIGIVLVVFFVRRRLSSGRDIDNTPNG